MKQRVPIAKQSKKVRKAYRAEQRGSWNGVNPVTKVVPSGKTYNRAKIRQEARSLARSSGEERA